MAGGTILKKLYFIRHGLTEMNARGVFSGTTETPLTAEGRAQAKKAGRLAKRYRINLIVSSPLTRAYDTAKIIAKEIGYPAKAIVVNRLLIERHFGTLEGQPWSPDLNLDGFSDIETDDRLLERAHLALSWLETLSADNILVVSHGAFGRALRAAIRRDKVLATERLNNAELHDWL